MLDSPLVRALTVVTACSWLGCGSGAERPARDSGGAHDGGLREPLADGAPGRPAAHDAGASWAERADGGPLPEPAYELQEVRANGFTFNVWVAGPAAGEAVLLLHGFPQSSHEWHKVVPALVARGYRVIAPDQRGYSPKARPTRDEDYALVLIAQDALALADALSVRTFHLVGHDWGGGVAWLVARLAPLRVLSLTAVGTPHPDAMGQALADPSSCQHGASSYFDEVVKPDAAARFVADPSALIPKAAQLDPLPEIEPYLWLWQDEAAMDAVLAWYRANVEERRFTAITLGAVDVPTLMVLGDKELFFCRDSAEASAKYVAAPFRFVLIPGVGHWIAEQTSATFLAELLPHLEAQRGRVRGAATTGPDPSRPLGDGSSALACEGAPRFDVPSELMTCDETCPHAHCMPASMLGSGGALAPACEGGAGLRCVPDALSRALGRFALQTCKSWLPGPAVCVPRCLAGVFSAFLLRGSCNQGELCAPCKNPLTGEPTGACEDRCQGL